MAPEIIDKPWVLAGRLLKAKGLTLAAAESCTGGLLSSLLTDVPGSSDYFIGSVVAYGNEVKTDELGVRPSTLKRYGAVSGQTAKEMALGVKEALKTDAA
ncbi:MAG: nicotinamide-nucleotide amidohydrolase family protein, partial [Deltaproteobacteria bacterium]|nr:nicotinamide-nucleotide amidohydrolase family protein [Deltaproteobacteria bacterium]